ncbi:TonB-dependent receptor [Sphingobium baderi]|uniref:TonB-dependent receptor n=1 Tax=Sphingobium baderi TaxID=1332080 RepID=A0A0S3EYA6_9SPHN|nr:TonB-dependent receptor [Sphingobium baderi]ALR20385.1 hypothetical protein ATN00_08775 [Sphingobium baderi]
MNQGYRFKRSGLRFALLANVGLIAFAQPVQAQVETAAQSTDSGGLQDIVVTARRTEESAQRTPIAITALSSTDLERRQITDLKGVQYSAPNINIATYPGDPSSITIQMRGQVQTDLVATSDPAIGVYLDGVYLGRGNGSSLTTLDLERIEVLRGPQGTLFGRNTTGGALNIVSKDPSDKLEGFMSGSVGKFDSFDLSGALTIPINDKLAVRGAFQHSQSGGYFKDTYNGQNLLDNNVDVARLKLKWQPTDAFTVLLAGDYSDITGNGAAFKLISVTPGAALNLLPAAQPGVDGGRAVSSYIGGDPYANQSQLDNAYHARLWGTSLTMTLDLGDAQLKSITAYRELKRTAAFDYDGTPYVIAEANSVDLRQHQFSQELQLNGSAFDHRLTYTGGLFYFAEHARDITRNDYLIGLAPPPFTRAITDGEVENDSYAAYAQATYEVLANTRITAGLRYTRDTRELISRNRGFRSATFGGPVTSEVCSLVAVVRDNPAVCQATLNADFGYWSYTLGVDHQLTDNVLIYARTGRSYKAGGFNIRSTTVPDSFAPFAPEKLTDYEVGVKADLFDHHLRNNLAVFYSDYRNMQRTLQVATPAGPNPSANFTTNAKKAHIFGIENELTGQIGGLRVTVSGGYLKPVYDDYRDTAAPFTDRSGEPFIEVSKYNVSVSGQYELATGFGKVRIGGDYSYRTKFYFAPQDTIFQKGYGLANAQVAVDLNAIPGLEVSAYVRNLTDKYYNIYMLQLPALGFASVTPGEPRTYGAKATFRF